MYVPNVAPKQCRTPLPCTHVCVLTDCLCCAICAVDDSSAKHVHSVLFLRWQGKVEELQWLMHERLVPESGRASGMSLSGPLQQPWQHHNCTMNGLSFRLFCCFARP